jgi:hypothetical protein
MASNELRNRANWQTISGSSALKAEDVFAMALQNALDTVYPNIFLIDQHPKEFGDIYSKFVLPKETLSQIYNVNISEKSSIGGRRCGRNRRIGWKPCAREHALSGGTGCH